MSLRRISNICLPTYPTPSIADAWVSSSIPSEPRSQSYGLGVDEDLPSHYPYIPSTAHHQRSEKSTAHGEYGWSNYPRGVRLLS